MIRKISHGLLLSGLMLGSYTQAALPDNVLLQRDTLRSLTSILQLQAEGLHPQQRRELQQDMQQLQQLLHQAGHTNSGYAQSLELTLKALDGGKTPGAEELDQLHAQAITLLGHWHNPNVDNRYLPLLMTEYLTMRYAFSSYIGNPSTSGNQENHYYTTDISELLSELNQQLTGVLTASNDNALSARWGMLHHALSDTHEGWTRTRSGNAFMPIVVIRNSRAFGNQLVQLLDKPDAVIDR